MKTICFSITHGFQARDLLRTDVFRTLCQQGVRIVILTPNHRDEYFRKEFDKPNVFIEPLFDRVGRFEERMIFVRKYAVGNLKLNRTLNLLNEQLFRRKSFLKVAPFRALNTIFGRMPKARKSWIDLERRLFNGAEYAELFEKYRPDLVVTGTPGFIPADAHLLRFAQTSGVPTACVVLSWDNLSGKGHMGAMPDHLIVWNEIMKGEAVEFHDVDPARIQLAGVSHFDIYADRSALCSRDAFCSRLGLDPGRRILLFGTVTPLLFPHNLEIARILSDLIQEDRLAKPCQLIIRLHPQVMNPQTPHAEAIERFQELASQRTRVVLDLPGVRSKSLMWDLPESDMRHLAELMLHSDVTLNAASTLTIDSAIFDTPIINIGFDGDVQKPYPESILRAYDYTHFQRIVKTGGVRVARSVSELTRFLNDYLADRDLDREGRCRIVREQCLQVDGLSGKRVANVLLKVMGLPEVSLGGGNPN